MKQKLKNYGLSLPGAWEDYPFGDTPLVLKAGSKMFALLTAEQLSLKCDPLIAESLREQHRAVTPGFHLNKKHWNSIALDGSIPVEELQAMIDHSYELVFRSLTKAERERISGPNA